MIELGNDPDKRRVAFWRSHLAEKEFDYVICSRQNAQTRPSRRTRHDGPSRRTATRDTVLTVAASRAQFPLIRITAAAKYEPNLLREKLIADYRLAKAGTAAGGAGGVMWR